MDKIYILVEIIEENIYGKTGLLRNEILGYSCSEAALLKQIEFLTRKADVTVEFVKGRRNLLHRFIIDKPMLGVRKRLEIRLCKEIVPVYEPSRKKLI